MYGITSYVVLTAPKKKSPNHFFSKDITSNNVLIADFVSQFNSFWCAKNEATIHLSESTCSNLSHNMRSSILVEKYKGFCTFNENFHYVLVGFISSAVSFACNGVHIRGGSDATFYHFLPCIAFL